MPTVIVVGAGVLGASLGYRLAADGWAVTLVDRHPPGHVRAASGASSRLLRFAHGEDLWLTKSARRALALWLELQEEVGTELFVRSGFAWFAHDEDGWEAESERMLADHGIPAERIHPEDARSLFPDLATEDLSFVLYEPDAGALHARRSVRALARQTLERGGRFLAGVARPVGSGIEVEGERLTADCLVWACGSWMPGVFPDIVPGKVIKQDIFFFGGPGRWQSPPVPAWADRDRRVSGAGDLAGRGFKVGPDTDGPAFDPEDGPRVPADEHEEEARAYLGWRFPSLAKAPLLGTETCQYTILRDEHGDYPFERDFDFLITRHPDNDSVWILGGGSGHGFKHGPAVAEHVASLLAGEATPDPRFALPSERAGGSDRA